MAVTFTIDGVESDAGRSVELVFNEVDDLELSIFVGPSNSRHYIILNYKEALALADALKATARFIG